MAFKAKIFQINISIGTENESNCKRTDSPKSQIDGRVGIVGVVVKNFLKDR